MKVLRIDDGRGPAPMAVVMHAVCHPCVFTWGDKWSPPYPNGYPKISADSRAKPSVRREGLPPTTQTLFLQGCSGNIRPNLPGQPYRCGDEADIRWTGRDLGCEVVRTADRTRDPGRNGQTTQDLSDPVCVQDVNLPGKNKEKPIRCEFQSLSVGPYLLLTIPGEPFVRTAIQLEKAVAGRAVPIVVGYANGGDPLRVHGQSLEEGGYEPNMTPLAAESEPIIVKKSRLLADRVIGDVFEAFAPRFPLENKNYSPSIPIDPAKKK